ncbi:hypothetical protein [Nocardiopsis sp. FR26]|uniref:hypothetical protein n=1 Tax=Nocardiopsis sp. FR26 TaxID=2605987 RepID=UPI00135B4F5A|nr:hypothetical protein [Nocardiopsis sp. FR26]
MAEAKNRKTRRTLAAVRNKYAEKLELESAANPVVPFDGEDGNTYSFPHPLFANDEWTEQVDAADTTAGKAKAILGEEQYEQFRKHPDHRDADIMLMFLEVNQATQGQLTDGGPTRS